MRQVKAGLSLVLLFCSLGPLLTTQSGNLYPWIVLIVGIALLILSGYINVSLNQSSFIIILSTIVMLAVLYRVYIFLFPSTIIGIDPQDYVIWLEEVEASGELTGTSAPGFYTRAGVFLSFITIGSIITGLKAATALALIPIITGIGTALFAGILTYRCSPTRVFVSAIAAAITGGFIAASIRSGYLPIAQSLAEVYFVILIYIFIRYLSEPDARYLAVGIILLSTLAATHKLSIVFVFVAAIHIFFLSLIYFQRKQVSRRILMTTVGFGSLSGIFLYLQMISTGYIVSVVFKAVALTKITTQDEQIIPTAAVPIMDPFFGYYWIGYALILMATAGVGWIILATHRPTQEQIVILGVSSAVVFLGGVGWIAGEFGLERTIAYGGVVLVALTIVSIGVLYDRRPTISIPYSVVITGVVILLLASSLSAPIATPDHDHYPRNYLTAAEYQTIDFANSYTKDEIQSDFLTTRVAEPVAMSDKEGHSVYKPFGKSLFAAEVVNTNHVLLRPHVDVYYAGAFPASERQYELTWNPENAYDEEYHRTYENGEGILYTNQTSQ